MNHNNSDIVTFKAIADFVNDLADAFEKKQYSLRCYRHLINKTQISNLKIIEKNIDIFRDFLEKNQDRIFEKETKLDPSVIKYSDKAYIDMVDIFCQSDPDTEKVIWDHLLYIFSCVSPSSRAKQILLEASKSTSNDESKKLFENLTNQISDLDSKDPQDAMKSIMSSGIMGDLIGGLQNGNIDVTNILGLVQNMVSDMESKDPNPNPAMGGLSQMIGNMTNMLGNMSRGGQGGQQPDMGQMMATMMSSLGNMGNNPLPVIQEEEEEQDEEEEEEEECKGD